MTTPRILMLADRLQVRGTTAYTLRLARDLKSYHITFEVISPDTCLLTPDRQKALGIKEYRGFQWPVWGLMMLRLLAQELKNAKPDLIHIQSRSVHSTGLWLARKLNCPYVLTVHDYLQNRERLRVDPELCKRVIAVSESVKAELIGHLPEKTAHCTIIHSGVDVPQSPPDYCILDTNRIPVVGTASPLEEIKGLPYFLRAAQEVHRHQPNVEFLISGAGPEEHNLRQLAQQLNLSDHVTFVPNLLDFSMSIKAMDLFCLPSLRQGLGTNMLEAMALGKPVIASGVGGIYSVVQDQQTGIIVPPSDSHRMAQEILTLLNNPIRARSLGAAGRRVVQEQFNVQFMLRKTIQVYNEVLNCQIEPKIQNTVAN